MDPTLYPDEGPQFDHKCFFSGAIGSQVGFRGLKEQKANYLLLQKGFLSKKV